MTSHGRNSLSEIRYSARCGLWRMAILGLAVMMMAVGCATQQETDETATDSGVPQSDSALLEVSEQFGLLGTEPEFCGQCHEDHFAQWSGSMHAYASQDPVFVAMVNKGIADTGGQIDQFCFQCHTPTASKLNLTPIEVSNGVARLNADLSSTPLSSGVTCVGCHMVEQVNATENAQLTYARDTLYGATVNEAAQEAHPIAVSPFFADPYQSSFVCGSCHNVLNPRGARLEATFSEWYASEYNQPNDLDNHQSCVTCHMPLISGKRVKDGPDGEIHSHRFVGVDQALIDFPDRSVQAELVRELLQNAAELEIRLNEETDGVYLVVSVTNTNTGHYLPSGSTADRQMWVHLQVRDGAGQLVYESGMLDNDGNLADGVSGHSTAPYIDPELLLFGQFVFGQSGEHVLFPWEVYSTADNLIAPGQRAWRDYPMPESIARNTTLSATATLKYRTFPPFVLRALSDEGFLDLTQLDPVPIIEMETVTATFER
jgi:hypothetical protein